MKDRRSVDDLSIDELQRVLAEKKRAAREARLAKYRVTGRALPAIGATPEARLNDARPAPAPRSLARRLFDIFLLVVEVGAVVGLIYVLCNGTNIMQRLNEDAAQVIAASVPTPGPTPRPARRARTTPRSRKASAHWCSPFQRPWFPPRGQRRQCKSSSRPLT